MDMIYISDAEGLKRLGGNKALYGKLLKRFADDISKYDVVKHIEDGDMEGAKVQAHTVKGMAANLSLKAAYDESIKIEEAIKDGTLNSEITENFQKVIEGTVEAIGKYLV